MILPLTLRSSSLGPALECPGRITAVPLVPPKQDDEASATGTTVHYVIAKRIMDEFGGIAGEQFMAPASVTLDPFAAWAADFCVEWAMANVPQDWSLIVEMPFEYEYALPEPVLVPLEEIEGEVPADHEVCNDCVVIRYVIITSHVDLVAISPCGRKLKAADWKSGRLGADAADNNWQAASYLAQLKLAYPDVTKAEFSMVQPLIDEEAGVDRITTVTRTGDELDHLIATICERLQQAVQNRFTTNSGIYQCQHCPVCGPLCPSIQAEKEARMKAQLTKEHIAALRTAPNDAVLSEFVISGRVLGKAFDAAEEALKERVEAMGGVVAPDGTTITMTTRGGPYEVTDPDAFLAAMQARIPAERDRFDCVKPSMTKLKDKLAATMGVPKESKKGVSAASVFDMEFRPHTEQTQAKILVFK